MPRGRPLLRRLRLPVSPRVHRCWCWLEDSNLPPLAYEASALPDELSQPLRKLTKGSRRRSRPESELAERAGIRRRVQIWTFTMSKSAAPRAPSSFMRMRGRGHARERTRACSRHTGDVWIVLAVMCGPSALLPDRRRGCPAPVIPVSVSSLGWPDHSCGRKSPNRPCTRQYAASRSVDPTVRWRR